MYQYNKYKYLNFVGAYVEKKYIYAASFEMRALFRIDKSKDQVKLLGKLDKYQHMASGVVCSIFRRDDYLFLFSCCSYEVVVYHLRTGEFSYYYPQNHNIVFDMVRVICRRDDEIWIFREAFEPLVAIFSLKDCTYKFRTIEWEPLQKTCGKKEWEKVVFETVCCDDNKIWRVLPGTNVLYTLDFDNIKIELYEIPCKESFYVFSEFDGIFYLTTIDGKRIVCWHPTQGIISRLELANEVLQNRSYRECIRNKDSGVLIPAMAGYLIHVNWRECQVVDINIIKFPRGIQKIYDSNERVWFIDYYYGDGRLLLFPFASNGALEIRSDSGEVIAHHYIIPAQDYLEILSGSDKLLFESDELQLQEYANILKEI